MPMLRAVHQHAGKKLKGKGPTRHIGGIYVPNPEPTVPYCMYPETDKERRKRQAMVKEQLKIKAQLSDTDLWYFTPKLYELWISIPDRIRQGMDGARVAAATFLQRAYRLYRQRLKDISSSLKLEHSQPSSSNPQSWAQTPPNPNASTSQRNPFLLEDFESSSPPPPRHSVSGQRFFRGDSFQEVVS